VAYDAPSSTFTARLKGRVILISLVIAFVFNMLPWRDLRGVPDLVALTLLFWAIHQPRRVSISVAFVAGLFMDAANGVLLGQHALVYSIIAFAGNTLSRRILGFSVWPQAAHVVVLLLLMQGLTLGIRLLAGGTFPGWSYFTGGIISALLWPLATFALLFAERAAESDQASTL
jgi:rod shape-determining protein MreD